MYTLLSFIVPLNYSNHRIYGWCHVEILLLEPTLFSLVVFFLSAFLLFYLLTLCLFGRSCLLFLAYVFFSSSLGESVLSFFFLWFSWILVYGRDSLFWKLSMFGYLLPFSSLYFGPPNIFVSIRVLHFSFSLCFLQLCSIGLCSSWTAGLHGTPACVYLSIPLLVPHICCTPFLCIWLSIWKGQPLFSLWEHPL